MSILLPFTISERMLSTTCYTMCGTQDSYKIYKLEMRGKDSHTRNIKPFLLFKGTCRLLWTSEGFYANPICTSGEDISKMCGCCCISALSFFKGFKMCHKILLGQGTRQATRWLRMIYFPDFRLLKRKCREKASTYLEADRIWKIKRPWSPSSTIHSSFKSLLYSTCWHGYPTLTLIFSAMRH